MSNPRRKLKERIIRERDGNDCWLCSRPLLHPKVTPVKHHPKSTTFDHVITVKAGGRSHTPNLRLAHFACNNLRGHREATEELKAECREAAAKRWGISIDQLAKEASLV